MPNFKAPKESDIADPPFSWRDLPQFHDKANAFDNAG